MGARRSNDQLRLLAALYLLLFLGCGKTSAQEGNVGNIDRLEPVVRESPVKDVPDSANDFWGWTSVFHSLVAPNSGDTLTQRAGNTRIMVGAPKGTFPGGLLGLLPDPGMPAAPLTGLVYSCPVRPGDCEGVRGDTADYLNDPGFLDNTGFSEVSGLRQQDIEGRLFDQAPNGMVALVDGTVDLYENKTEQLLGATLFSSGDRFVACAPRWTFQSSSPNTPSPRGICYTSGRNLQGFEQLFPCTGGTGTQAVSGATYCMAGTGFDIVDGDYVIGAPLDNLARGSLYYAPVGSPDSLTEQGGRRTDNATRSTYQGYKVTSGNIFSADTGSGPSEVLTTAPRYGDDYNGAVYIYDADGDRDAILPVNMDISGSQMGEFFGYSLTTADLNGDGYDEVIVGAPMYSDIGLSKIEKGRVYVFMNMEGTLDETPITLERSTPLSRFGTSVENLGDIDDDGREDVAIGAPYTPLDGGNSGAVFIYYGSSNFTAFVTQEPQVINASQIVSVVSTLNQLQTFGWSLSGRADVDNNNFDDLLIGAYESQAAILLRALPVVNITATIGPVSTPVNLDNPTCQCSVSPSGMCPCFTVTVQANFSTRGDTDALTVDFQLRERDDDSRIFFDRDNINSRVFAGTFTFNSPSAEPSQMITVYARTEVSNFEPYVLEIEIQPIERPMAVVDGNQEITSFAAVPKIRQTGDPTQSVMVRNPCDNDGCISDVAIVAVTPREISILTGANTTVDVVVTYLNEGAEDALDVVLDFDLHRIFSGISIGASGCLSGECALDSRLRPREQRMVTFRLAIDPNEIVGNEGSISVPIELRVNSEMGNMDNDTSDNNDVISFVISASADIVTLLQFSNAEVAYSSDPLGAGAVGSVDELGPRLDLVVTIRNAGPTPIPNANVTIFFPSRTAVTGNFYFLYPAELSNSNGTICTTSEDFNPENLLLVSQAQSTGNRRRRSAWSIGRHQRRRRALLDQHSRSTRQASQPAANSLMCSSSPMECISITCSITRLSGSATITIESYVDERFFFDKEGTYTLEASGSAVILDAFLLPEPTTNNADTSTVSVSPPELSGGPNILLVTILPIIAGLILVAILAVLLYFVGFFRRKKRPEEQEAEGDFDVAQYNVNEGAKEGGGGAGEPKEKAEEVTGL